MDCDVKCILYCSLGEKVLEVTILSTHDYSKQSLLKSERCRVLYVTWKIIIRCKTKIIRLSLECHAKKCGGEDRVLLGEASI